MTDRIDEWIKESLGENREVPTELVQQAKDLIPAARPGAVCPHCGKPVTPFKRSPKAQKAWNALWLIASAGSFALSFAFPRYFFQLLVATLLCGVKWIVENRVMKTQILIYKALSEGEGPEQSRLHRHASRL